MTAMIETKIQKIIVEVLRKLCVSTHKNLNID